MHFDLIAKHRRIPFFVDLKLFENVHKKLVLVEFMLIILLIRLSFLIFRIHIRLLVERVKCSSSHNVINGKMVDFFHGCFTNVILYKIISFLLKNFILSIINFTFSMYNLV